MKPQPPSTSTDWRRMVVGVLALIFLALGSVIYFYESGSADGMQGILIRMGLVLGAIWLALPQLGKLTFLQSAGALGLVTALILLAASRPNIFRVVATVLAIAVALNWALKWVALLGKRNR